MHSEAGKCASCPAAHTDSSWALLTVAPVASVIKMSSETQLRSVTTRTTGLGPGTVKVTLALHL
jgi:hypothetical protein